MKNLKKLFVAFLVVTLLMGVLNVVFATEADENEIIHDILDQRSNSNSNTNANTNTDSNSLFSNSNTNTNTNTANNSNTNTNTNTSSTYNNSNLPKAGSADGIFVIAMFIVLGGIALYTYKKIRDYNIR